MLQTENEELKKEVRKYRYAPSQMDTEKEFAQTVYEDDDMLNIVDGGLDAPEIVEPQKDLNISSSSSSVTFTPKENDVDIDEGIEVDFESTDFEEDVNAEEEEEEEEASVQDDLDKIFSLFKSAIQKTSKQIVKAGNVKLEGASKVIEKIKREAKEMYETVPDRNKINDFFLSIDEAMFAKMAELTELMSSQTAERHTEATQTAAGKLGKTIVQVLDKVAYKMGVDSDWLLQHWDAVQEEFNGKWSKIVDKYDRVVRKEEAKQFVNSFEVKVSSEEKKKEKRKLEQQRLPYPQSYSDPIFTEEIPSGKNYTLRRQIENAMPGGRNVTADWMFKRAQERGSARKEGARSDWLFDRADNRKRRHEFEYETDWSLKKAKRKHCEEGEDGQVVCRDIGIVSKP